MLRNLPPVLLLATNASESLARKVAESISQGAEIMEEPRAQSSDQVTKHFLPWEPKTFIFRGYNQYLEV